MTRPIDESRRELAKLCETLCRPVRVMEVCGTHTMTIAETGLRSFLPETLDLISGPGCPVCVTDQSYMDQAIFLAQQPQVTITTYGDMVRVPGREGSLAEARSRGAKVEVVYAAQQAVELARQNPERQVVFLAVGFETTAPATALAVKNAAAGGVENFSVLAAHKLILPAMNALLTAGDVRIDAFMCPGHVSVILGYEAYAQIAREFRRPCVVAGFDAPQVLACLVDICRQLIDDAPAATSVYPAASAGGNLVAMALLDEVFITADAAWRAIGTIPDSGLVLRPELEEFEAARRFDLPEVESYELPGCRCGDVICGRCRPRECGLFAQRCTPRDPVGPCMVSTEGACAAAYKYERH